jgi:hypothetical protein
VHGAEAADHDETYICDRIKGYLLSVQAVLYDPPDATRSGRSRALTSRRA